MADTVNSQAREKAMYRYTSALERGDFDTVAEVLALAESDPALAQMIRGVNEAMSAELEQGWHPAKLSARQSWRGSVRSFGRIAAVVLIVALVGIVVLTLIGPATGNVYNSSVASLPNASGGGVSHQAGLKPTSSIIEVTGVGGPVFAPGTPTPDIAILALPTGTPLATLPAGTPAPTAAPAGSQVPAIPTAQQMIVKNGEIDLVVKDTDTAIEQVTQIATDSGGYVLSTQASQSGDEKFATMTIGVRADQFETAMRRLRQMAIKVNNEISSGQDVTGEYVDLQSRLKNLEATRDRMASLLSQATSVADAVSINNQLSDIEGQIEQIKGRMTYLAGRSAYSTISVGLSPQLPEPPTPTPTLTPTATPPWSLSPAIDKAADSQVNVFRGLLEALAWLIIVPGPYLLAIGLGVWLFRRWRESRKSP